MSCCTRVCETSGTAASVAASHAKATREDTPLAGPSPQIMTPDPRPDSRALLDMSSVHQSDEEIEDLLDQLTEQQTAVIASQFAKTSSKMVRRENLI